MHLQILLQLMGMGEEMKEKKDMSSSFKAVTRKVCALLSISMKAISPQTSEAEETHFGVASFVFLQSHQHFVMSIDDFANTSIS